MLKRIKFNFSFAYVFLFFGWGEVHGESAGSQGAVLESQSEIIRLLEEDLSIEELLARKVISASKKPQRIIDAPANIMIIDREQIKERGYRNLSELLADLPGFNVVTGQPAGEYPTHIMVRGIGDVGQTKMLVMVDGVDQNDISSHWSRNLGYNFAFIDVERVEVISGPGSALYGADAYAAVVNVITRDRDSLFEGARNKLLAETALYYGSYNTITPEILLGYQWENDAAFWIVGRWYYSEGDMGIGRPDPGNYFHNNYEPTTVTTTEAGDVANTNDDGSPIALADGFDTSVDDLYFRGVYELNGFSLGFNWWLKREGLGSEVVGYEYFANTPGVPYQVEHSGYTVYVKNSGEITDKLSSNSKMFYRNTSILPNTEFVYTYKYQSVGPYKDKSKNYHGEGFAYGLDQQFDWELSEANGVTGGVMLEKKIQQYAGIGLGVTQDVSSNVVDSTYDTETPSVVPVYYTNEAGLYLQDEHKFSDAAVLTLGGRLDYNSTYGKSINPRVALVGTLSDMFGYKVLYGESFKAPSVFELYDEWRGNEDLEPEMIKTSELELNYFLAKRVLVKANFFHSRLENLIVVAPNPVSGAAKPIIYQNIGQTNFSGGGLVLNFELFQRFSFFSNYMFLIGEDFTEEVYNVPTHKAFLGMNYLIKNRVNINLTGLWSGRVKAPETALYYYPKTSSTIAGVGYDYVTEEDPDGYLDGYFLMNLTVTGKSLFKSAQVEPHLVVKNLLNTQYMTMGRQSADGVRPVDSAQPSVQNPNGFSPPYHPQPGIEVLFGLRYAL